MNKKAKLEKLDGLIIDRMIDILESKDEDPSLSDLTCLSVPANYLKANSVVSEKAKSTVEEDLQKRLDEANKRRKQKEDK